MEELLVRMSWPGILLATVLSYGLGGVWYGPLLFGKLWQKEVSRGEREFKMGALQMSMQMFATFFLSWFTFALIKLGGYPLFILGIIAFGVAEKAKAMFRDDTKRLIAIDSFYRLLIFVIAALCHWLFSTFF